MGKGMELGTATARTTRYSHEHGTAYSAQVAGMINDE
jgi:hypothetical protein